MKKALALFLVMAITVVILVMGCGGEVKTYSDSGQTISVNVNKEFVIALVSNPTTGYRWQASYDDTAVALVKSEYQQGETAKEGVVGAGGAEYFVFKALKKGQTEIILDYLRSWEKGSSIEQKVFTIDIK
ncbi:protease inhibitor I42 family protein [Chloroflexota bacterium]